MTSVIDEGKEQHTQRPRDEGTRDKEGTGGVLRFIKQCILKGGMVRSGLREVTGDLRWSGSQRGSSSCQ